MQTLDLTGKSCPIPVIETKKALEASAPGTTFEVIVDNPTSVENLAKFASQRGYGFVRGSDAPGEFRVQLTSPDADAAGSAEGAPAASGRKVRVVAVSSRTMGEGDERLGATLLKGFLYALTEADAWPDSVLFYNGGAYLTTEGSESIEDLKRLEDAGVQVLTCGTCLNHYGLGDKLAVGGVSNMYTIVEILSAADLIIKP
ncbi:sulfurtransferase-like selenium metabolism protein YedF [Propioniciclava tarda]|mgnify:CR=1 FL=1|uniref:Sulfurtransferase-like selenium metabolism protein YedF n=1 Tax=Propioniciclava tarda TaxID=433330 RepID=A0A4Q9KLT8_PROTD|nr:sulfurtransferase-like selenium metabolism protein YedF [Propioniciclava tarda]TBT95496.1 sulfurtransferase-like selenium metabolism protein YedF [Propioniciclava tarda]SMO50280.1 selenium metabolism protein YedF [Propioniciclava tarda]HOA88809.1 sulfurtransferase-like selenium metabolism protein YedF [Propioniciclava tarda]HQA30408.1 sulfurtransferase-like selenium metabolism protein YedF [Propioniciclava tarda]HQD61013.1 sulfurtransferase-like selenium metabolism protein YedF [Propionicic